jgi:hypothetical protein
MIQYIVVWLGYGYGVLLNYAILKYKYHLLKIRSIYDVTRTRNI